MEKKNKKEELQSRRQFFKKAAKGVLPILGAIALANVPMFAQAGETASGCTGTCYGGCRNACTSCSTTCYGGCKNSCTSCTTTCSGGCKNGSR